MWKDKGLSTGISYQLTTVLLYMMVRLLMTHTILLQCSALNIYVYMLKFWIVSVQIYFVALDKELTLPHINYTHIIRDNHTETSAIGLIIIMPTQVTITYYYFRLNKLYTDTEMHRYLQYYSTNQYVDYKYIFTILFFEFFEIFKTYNN